ncbi:MAG: CAP domain-containing protein, partial [Clostridiales Family XIII bacterium]|nr:CAP domain-containing protein [Clostridiales Family XIII bacterium]
MEFLNTISLGQWKRAGRLALVAALCAALVCPFAAPGGIDAYAATGTNVQAHSADDIRAYIKASGAKTSDATKYATTPVTIGPGYNKGSLTQASLDSALKMLNQIRYIAGIDADVKLDPSQTELAQGASFINAVNGQLSHYPTQPADMSQSLFDLCNSGAQSTNIAWNYGTLGSAILDGWMEDGDSSNIDRVGHRRWMLNPKMGKTGFGKTGAYTAMYSFDASRTSSYTGVAWPAQNMPVEYFGAYYPWTFSVGSSVDGSSVKVVLKRDSDGKSWTFSSANSDGYFNVNNQGYGQIGCIIFRPSDTSYKAGDSFSVTITGAPAPISYKVNFFALEPPTPPQGNTATDDKNAASGKVTKPAAVAVKSVKSKKSRQATITWKPNSEYSGYELLLSTAKNFKKGKVKAVIKGGKKTKA